MSALPPTAMTLGVGEAVRVTEGELLVFAARSTTSGPGRWALVERVRAPAVVVGADLPGVVVIGSRLPDARVTPLRVDQLEVVEREVALHPGRDALAALRHSEAQRVAKANADALSDEHDAWVVQDALTDLADAVPGHVEHAPDTDGGDDIAVMVHLAGLVGLPADPVRLRRAVTDAQVSGRDRVAALTAACDATARRVELSADWWSAQGPPLLVRTAAGSSAAAAWSRGSYRLWTAATPRAVALTAETAATLQPWALVLRPLLDPSRPATLRELTRTAMRGSGSSAAVIVAMTAVVGLLSGVVPVVTGRVTTAVADGAGTPLAAVAAALVLLVAALTLLRAVRTFALVRVRTSATSTAAAAVWDRQLRLPMSWHKRRTQVERMTNATAVDLASAQASDSAVVALLDTAAVVGSILGALVVDSWVALSIVVLLLARSIIDLRVARRMGSLSGQLVDHAATDPTLELLRGVMRLRSSGALARGYATWARHQAASTRLRVRLGRVGTTQAVLSALWPTLGLAVVLTVVALTSAGSTENEAIGILVTAQTALTTANTALAAAIASVGALLSARAILQRADPVLASLPESAGGGEVAPLTGGIDLRGVVYRYGPELPAIIEGLDLTVSPGEHLAIVGPSGSGKTTLLRLMLGLDDPEAGLVAYDGRDLTGLDRSAVRRQIGAVMQSSALLPGTIRDNVDMGRGLTATEVWDSLALAAVDQDVRSMPMGLNTVVVEGGAGVSGGQRQRILLARALAGRPRVVILDEATSALDNVSQAAVVANLDRLDVTRIVVAHRLSTIRRADRIAVLAGGRIVQQGTYQTLLTAGGAFRDLVDRQLLDHRAGV